MVGVQRQDWAASSSRLEGGPRAAAPTQARTHLGKGGVGVGQ